MLFINSRVKESRPLPALSENSFLRYYTFAALYIAQGIPEGLLWYAIPAWLAMNGKSPVEYARSFFPFTPQQFSEGAKRKKTANKYQTLQL